MNMDDFRKVSRDYVAQAAKIAKRDGVEGFSLVTSMGAKKGSFIPPLDVRGEIEEQVSEMNFDQFSIYHPGVLLDRPKMRWQEQILTRLPLVPKASVKTIAKEMERQAVMGLDHQFENDEPQVCTYENGDIIRGVDLTTCRKNPFFKRD